MQLMFTDFHNKISLAPHEQHLDKDVLAQCFLAT